MFTSATRAPALDPFVTIDRNRIYHRCSALTGRSPTIRYELVETVYRGDMFVVERGRQRELGRDVAAKRVRPDTRHRARALRSAMREARVRAGVTHPNLLPLYELAGG